MITAKYILENEAGERFDLTAPANIFLVNVEGLGITTNVTYGDLGNGFFHTLYEQTPQNNITGDLVYQNAAYDNYRTLVNWIIRAKVLYFCYQPLETEYRRIVKLNYIVKERRTAGGWMKAGISFAPLTPWYLAQPTEIGMGGIEEELSKGYFQDGEASPTIEPVQDLHGYDHPWPGGGGKNKFDKFLVASFGGTLSADGRTMTSASFTSESNVNMMRGSFSEQFDVAQNDILYLSFDYRLTSGTMEDFFPQIVSTDSGFPAFMNATSRQAPAPSATKQRGRFKMKASSSKTAYGIYIQGRVPNGAVLEISNVSLSWEEDYTFSPYSNICPITPGLTLVRDDESTLVVWGGTLDAATGKLTVDRAMVDLGTLGWIKHTRNLFYTYNFTAKPVSASSVVSNLICSEYKTLSGNAVFARNDGISMWSTSSNVAIYDPDKTGLTTGQFKTAMSGVQLVYELATPIEYQLTASELRRALDALDGHYAYRYTEELRYGGDAAGTMSATIEPSGHVPAAVVLRYTGAITNPRVRLVGAETGIVYGICAINTSLNPGQTFELSTRYEDSHVILIDGDGTETSLLGDVNPAYEIYFRCPTTESAVLTLESDNAFSGEATLLVYTYFGSV